MNKFSWVTVVLLALNFGCASSSYTVKVDAISDPELKSQNFTIRSGMKDAPENDLRFKQFAKVISNALVVKGMTASPDISSADVVIMVSYGISDPDTRAYTRSVPVYGGGSTTTTVTNSYGQQLGTFQTQQSNPYAPTGYQSVTDEVTTYNRFILLTAYDAKDVMKPMAKDEKFNPRMAWETKITSSGSSGDLRKVFPVMMIGALPYIGENMSKQKTVELNIDDEKDPRILRLTGTEVQAEAPRSPAEQGGR